jgi:hypothetical protein
VIDILSKFLDDGKSNAVIFVTMIGALYVGKMQIDVLSQDVAELKQEQKDITKFLAKHATTWARIAERVKIHHKDD